MPEVSCAANALRRETPHHGKVLSKLLSTVWNGWKQTRSAENLPPSERAHGPFTTLRKPVGATSTPSEAATVMPAANRRNHSKEEAPAL